MPGYRSESSTACPGLDDLQPPEFLDEPVLMRAVVALDAPFRLRGIRRDNAQVEGRAHPAELRQWGRAGDLLLGIGRPHVDILPIRVERMRYTVLRDPAAQHRDRRPDRFLGAELAERPPRGIVYQRHQAALRCPILVQAMDAAIEPHELANVSLAGPA